jgi:adenylylsulfate kinase
MTKATNIVWHASLATREDRTRVSGSLPTVVWLTGLSGCGKSTIAVALEKALLSAGHMAYVLDGDNVRHGLNKNLGFSPEDRAENIRRIGEVAKLFADAGVIAITSFISPYRADRAAVRSLLKPGEFVEVFVDAPLEVCESRDPKGLYKKARAAVAEGKGLMFTGIDAPYEAPEAPELHLRSDREPPESCVNCVIAYLRKHGRLGGGGAEGERGEA